MEKDWPSFPDNGVGTRSPTWTKAGIVNLHPRKFHVPINLEAGWMDGISHHMVVGKEVIMHACTHMKRTHTPLRSSTLARIPRRTGTFASVVVLTFLCSSCKAAVTMASLMAAEGLPLPAGPLWDTTVWKWRKYSNEATSRGHTKEVTYVIIYELSYFMWPH